MRKQRPRTLQPWQIRRTKQEYIDLQAAKAVDKPKRKPRPLFPTGKQTHFHIDRIQHAIGALCWCDPEVCLECGSATHNHTINGQHSQQCELCEYGIVDIR